MKTALIIVCMQNDFCNGGSMAFENALEIIPIINRTRDNYDYTIFIKKTYPDNHAIFKEYGGKLPKHCIENTYGQKIHDDIIIKNTDYIINIGCLQKYDSNSAFFEAEDIEKETKLKTILDMNDIKNLYFCGNDMEKVIFSTIMDAINRRYKCYIVENSITFNNKEKSQKLLDYLSMLKIECVQ